LDAAREDGTAFAFFARVHHTSGCPVLAHFARAGNDAAKHQTGRLALPKFVFPPFANRAKDEAPRRRSCRPKSKAGPPAGKFPVNGIIPTNLCQM
jgi:hypothetical protein